VGSLCGRAHRDYMKTLLALLIALAIGPAIHAQANNQEEAFCRQLVALVRLAPTDYRDHRGTATTDDDSRTFYTATPPYPDLHAARQGIIAPKNGEAAYYSAVYQGEEAVTFAQTAFLGLSPLLVSRQGDGEYAGFTAHAIIRKLENGDLYAHLFYKGIVVAKLEISAARDVAYIFIGLLYSKDPAADRAILSTIPAQPVGPTTESAKGREKVLSGEPFNKPAGAPAPAAEDPMVAFTRGSEYLVARAASDFDGLTKEFFRKTADGTLLYNAVLVPDMQAESDAQMVMVMQGRHFYMTSYDDERSVAFAFAAFLALPQNAQNGGAFKVELDSRLENPQTSGYHLRYNGVIVADLVKYKTKPKVLVTFGYRDGIPRNLLAGSGRTYSESAIAAAKQKVVESTVCSGCQGKGTEEIDTGLVHKGSGLPVMRTVPCHFCQGKGHL